MHNTSISYNDLVTEFPTRKDFLDSARVAKQSALVARHEPILFHPNDVTECNIKHNERMRYALVMYGILPDGSKTGVIVRGITPYVLFRVPDEYLELDLFSDSVPDDAPHLAEQYGKVLMDRLKQEEVYPVGSEVVRYYRSNGFQRVRGFYIRVNFNTTSQRKRAIQALSYQWWLTKRNYEKPLVLDYVCETAHDDATCYYRVVCRDYGIHLCGWNTLTDYELMTNIDSTVRARVQGLGEFGGDRLFECDISDVMPYTEELSAELKQDPMIEMAWDIEAYRDAQDGEIPDPEVAEDEVFMVCMTFAFYSNPESFLRVAIVNTPCAVHERDVTIVCANERELVMAFAQVIGAIKPEFVVGFNDGDFDHPFMAEKAFRYGLMDYFCRHMACFYKPAELWKSDKDSLGDLCDEAHQQALINMRLMGFEHRGRNAFVKRETVTVTKSNILQPAGAEITRVMTPEINAENEARRQRYMRLVKHARARGSVMKHDKVKLDPETYGDVYSITVPGTINIDARCMFRALYKNPEQSSLNWFLRDNKLELKEDMPIVELFRIYREMREAIRESDRARQCDLADDMGRVKSYCVTDSESCHRLMLKRNVIMDARNKSLLAYTSMFDAIYRADGVKVRNLTFRNAIERDIVYSNINKPVESKAKYPGAYVVPPEKGMQTSKLSIEERVRAGRADVQYPYNGRSDFRRWASVTPEEVSLMEGLVAEYWMDNDEVRAGHRTVTDTRLPPHLRPLFEDFINDLTGRPTSGLDFSSLYPSVMMAYNFSPECTIEIDYGLENSDAELEERADRLRALGYTLHRVEFPYGEGDEVQDIRAYTIRHTYDPANAEHDPAERGFGIFPTILHRLFGQRKGIKKEMKRFAKIIEDTGRIVGECKKLLQILGDDAGRSTDLLRGAVEEGLVPPETTARNLMDALRTRLTETEKYMLGDDYQAVVFDYDYLNSKQLALKVFMNTFYGESGNKRSSLFMLPVSGGITTGGQYNIKSVISYVTDNRCRVIYGDTDSAYIQCPERSYREIDIRYYSGQMTKLEYWTELVQLTFGAIEDIKNATNAMLRTDNGTDFLKVAYEEVLYPVAFMAKKKYYGLPHEEEINFFPKKMFLRGFDMKKRGVPPILIKTCSDIMWASLRPDELRTLRGIVIDMIKHVHTAKWEPSDFEQTAQYKPRKQNVRVQTFVRRMREERAIDIKPNERFNYVMVKKPAFRWDTQGKTIRATKGDLMELIDVAVAENMEIDLREYMSGKLKGQFGRLIVYHADFERNVTSEMTYTQSEKVIFDNACREVARLCEQYEDKPINCWKMQKGIYRTVNGTINRKLAVRGSGCTAIATLDTTTSTGGEVVVALTTHARKRGHRKLLKAEHEYIDNLIRAEIKRGATLYTLRDSLCTIKRQRGGADHIIALCEQYANVVRGEMSKFLSENSEVFRVRNAIIEQAVEEIRDQIDMDMVNEDTKFEDVCGDDLRAYIEYSTDVDTEDLLEYSEQLHKLDKMYKKLEHLYRKQTIYRAYSDRILEKLCDGVNHKLDKKQIASELMTGSDLSEMLPI